MVVVSSVFAPQDSHRVIIPTGRFSPTAGLTKSSSFTTTTTTTTTFSTTFETALFVETATSQENLKNSSRTSFENKNQEKEHDDDENSDVSSISSSESSIDHPQEDDDFDCTNATMPRSIFSAYWEKQGGAPGSLRRTAAANNDIPQDHSLLRSEQLEDSVRSINTYELVLCTQEKNTTTSSPPQATPPSNRRSIFHGRYHSAPQLSLQQHRPPRDSLRKARSTSAFSSSSRSASSSSDRSVSFSPKVSVVVFTTPQEQWARQGWSDYFV